MLTYYMFYVAVIERYITVAVSRSVYSCEHNIVPHVSYMKLNPVISHYPPSATCTRARACCGFLCLLISRPRLLAFTVTFGTRVKFHHVLLSECMCSVHESTMVPCSMVYLQRSTFENLVELYIVSLFVQTNDYRCPVS